MADTKYYDAVNENVAQMKSMRFLTDYERVKFSPLIYVCSIGPSCITVRKREKNQKEIQQQTRKVINQLRKIWLMYCKDRPLLGGACL